MWQILINGPGYFDTQYNLPDGDTHLGRADENDVVLTGDKVSRRHARIRVDGLQVLLEDLGSRNGTQLNGESIGGEVTLKSGDTFAVGENSLLLKQPEESEVARTEMVSDQMVNKLSAQASEMAGQVLMSRDLAANSFLSSFDEAISMSVEELETQSEGTGEERQSLMLLYKVVDKLGRAPNLDAFLQEMLDLVMELAKATTGVILLKNTKGTFSPVVVRHSEALGKGEIPISDAVVAEVVQKKVALCVADVRDDARFANRESVIMYGVNQVLCTPMMHDGAIIGLIYLNRLPGMERNLEKLLDLLTSIAQLAASGAQQARLKAKVQSEEKLRRTLERFHAPDVVERVIKDLARTGGNGAVEERTATVVFAEICGFNGLVERLPAARVVEVLNDFYRRMARVIFSFGGTVDKFVGDSVIAIFGAPYSRPDDASRAVRASLAMRRDFHEMVTQRKPEERCGIRLGAATGRIIAGIVGSDARLDYTALGEAVSLAAALEASALPGQVVVDQATLEGIDKRFNVSPVGTRTVKGRPQPVEVFEITDEDMEWTTNPGL